MSTAQIAQLPQLAPGFVIGTGSSDYNVYFSGPAAALNPISTIPMSVVLNKPTINAVTIFVTVAGVGGQAMPIQIGAGQKSGSTNLIPLATGLALVSFRSNGALQDPGAAMEIAVGS